MAARRPGGPRAAEASGVTSSAKRTAAARLCVAQWWERLGSPARRPGRKSRSAATPAKTASAHGRQSRRRAPRGVSPAYTAAPAKAWATGDGIREASSPATPARGCGLPADGDEREPEGEGQRRFGAEERHQEV